MDTRHIAAVEAVITTGSYSAAARRVHLSQPALWAQVKALEAEIGVPLFVRVGRGVTPTGACRALLPRLRAVLDGTGALQEAARSVREGRAAPARIMCGSSHIAHFLAPCIARLARRHPELPPPEIINTTSATIERDLVESRADLIVHPRLHARVRGVVGLRLYPVTLVVLRKTPIRGPVDVRDLAGRRVATLPADSAVRTLLERAAADARVALDVVWEGRDIGALISLARHGVCDAVALSEMLPDDERARAGELVSKTVTFRDEMWLSWRTEESLSPAARLLRDTMREEASRRTRGRRP